MKALQKSAWLLFALLCLGGFAVHKPLGAVHHKKAQPLAFVADSSVYRLDTARTQPFKGNAAKQTTQVLQRMAAFDKALPRLPKDTFSVFEQTTEGCEIVVAKSARLQETGFFGTLFGEMGRRHFRFYASGKAPLQLYGVIFKDVTYDRPMYQPEMKILSTRTTYQIYAGNRLVAVLDGQKRKQNKSPGQLRTLEAETKQFFKDYVGQIRGPE